MNKDIESILIANDYFTKCKLEKEFCSKKTDLARKYLIENINKVLNKRKLKSQTSELYF